MSLNPLQTARPSAPGLFNPQPYETTRRNNRKPAADQGGLFQPQIIETTRRSNRTTLVRKVEEVVSEAPSAPPTRAPSPTQEYATPTATERKSLASSIFFPKESPKILTTGTQTPDYFNSKQTLTPAPPVPTAVPAEPKKQILPQPVETTRRSNKRPPPVQTNESKNVNNSTFPPTPPHSEASPTLPQPFEVTRRSNRPLARPLVPQPAEEAPKSNLTRRPEMNIDLSDLPQPISTSRWTNKVFKPGARHLRRSSTVQPPGTPGLYYFVPETGQASASPAHAATNVRGPGKWVRPHDHVEHLGEPVDSAPPSPHQSPKSSRNSSLNENAEQSLTKQPKKVGIHGRRDSMEDGYAGYILDVQRRKLSGGPKSPKSPRSPKSPKASGLRQEIKVPKPMVIPVSTKHRRDSEAEENSVLEREKEFLRAKARGETLKPVKINIPRGPVNKVYDEYPIFASPTRDHFLPTPERVPTKDLTVAKPIPAAETKVLATTPNLPTPPDSNPNSSQTTLLTFGRIKVPVVGLFYPSSFHNYHHPSQLHDPKPSPGITVASLPPRPATQNSRDKVPIKPEDVTDEFVGQVWRYLSLGHECIAKKYDEELAEYTGMRVELVVRDRFAALRQYVKLWVGSNPEVGGGERLKGGLW
ncbi:hypothetical protein BDZ91DRAFT_131945 [Kalaharituber pfeilii]|nr:hypothetical protein BDZ91DRAFT_131945 [Kalaharituber pfeilii]